MKFQYTSTNGVKDCRGKLIKRPIIHIELSGENGEKIKTIGLIDSGADTSVLNVQFARALGINLKPRDSIIGISNGKVDVQQGIIKIRIIEMDEEIEMPATFIDSSNVNVLLGQEAFFDLFRIKFEKDHDTFEITKVLRK